MAAEVLRLPDVPARRDGPRRGLRRDDAARYIGVGATKFDSMVKDGRMPPPREIDGCRIWDIRELDIAFDDLPSRAAPVHNPWDDE